MRTNELVSVIVPVYNVEDYLDCCIQSIVNQTYSNLEIILVDDGSTDNSLVICKQWKDIDDRIIVYSNDNHGVSYTRNFAIKHCHGKYITFIDSDDITDSRYVSEMVELIEKTSSDLSIVSYCCFFDNDSPVFSSSSLSHTFENNLEEIFFTITAGTICGKLYKMSLICDNQLFFNEKIAVTEDLLFNIQYASHCRSAVYCNSALYGYRQRNNSAVHNTISPKWFTCLDTYKYLFEKCDELTVYPYIVYHYLKNLYEARYLVINKQTGIMTKKELEDQIARVEKKVYIVPLKMKLRLFICKHFFWIVDKRRKRR